MRVLTSKYSFITLAGKAQTFTPQTSTAAAGVLQNEYFPGTGGGGGGSNQENPEYYPGQGGSYEDPDHILTQALLCFNEKQIYSSCSEAYRLSASGELHVPPETTDEYCTGPCISETHHVLDCLENLLQQFKFYNKATIYDVRETIKAGCSHGPQRGDFNVAKYIQADYNNAQKSWRFGDLFLHGLLLIIFWACHLCLP